MLGAPFLLTLPLYVAYYLLTRNLCFLQIFGQSLLSRYNFPNNPYTRLMGVIAALAIFSSLLEKPSIICVSTFSPMSES